MLTPQGFLDRQPDALRLSPRGSIAGFRFEIFRAAKSEAHSPITKLQLLGDLPKAGSLLLESDDFVPVYNPARTAELLSRGAGIADTSTHPLTDQVPLQLGDRRDYREKSLLLVSMFSW